MRNNALRLKGDRISEMWGDRLEYNNPIVSPKRR